MTENIPLYFIDDFIPFIRDKVTSEKKKKSVMMIMGGHRGIGKSTTSLELQLEFDPQFDIQKQVSWDFEEIVQRETELIPPGKGHHIDEIRFDTMDFRTSEGVMIKKVIKEIRPYRHFVTLNTPDAGDVMPIFFDYSDYYVHFKSEGVMYLLERNENIIRGNRFGLNNKDIYRIKDDKTFKKYFINPAIKAGTLLGRFEFPQYTRLFNKARYEEYNNLRLQKSRELINGKDKKSKREESLKGVIDRAFVYAYVESKIGVKEVCKMFGISRATFYNWCTRLNISKDMVII